MLRAARLAFLALGVVAVGQVAVLFIAEPYPSLLGPRFRNPLDRGGYIMQLEPEMSAVDRAGRRHPIRYRDLLQETGVSLGVARRTFRTQQQLDRRDLKPWLCRELRARGVHDPETFRVNWVNHEISTTTGAVQRKTVTRSLSTSLAC